MPADGLASPEDIRRVTEEVLSRADYNSQGGTSFLGRIVRELLEQIGRLLLRLDSDGGFNSILGAAGLVLVVVAVVVVIGLFLRKFRRSAVVSTVVEGPVGRGAASWAEEAERFERAGDLRQALRCRYRETLAQLAAANLVDEVPGRTTGEYRLAAGAALPAAAGPFGAFTEQFEDVWYGGDAVDGAGLAQAKQRQADVGGLIPGRRARQGLQSVGSSS